MESAASDGRQFFQAFPRITWGGKTVSDEFCAWNEDSSSCQWVDYAQAMSLIAMPSLVVGLICTILFAVLFCIRCCCIGKRCCVLPFRGRFCERAILSLFFFIVAVCIVGMVGLGVLGTVWSHQGIDNASDSASDFSANVINITNDAVALLLEIDASYSEQAQEALKEANDVKDTLDKVLNILKKAEIARFIVILSVYAAILTTIVLGIVSVLFLSRILMGVGYWYSWLLFLLACLILTACIVMGAGMSDVCDVLDDSQDGNDTNIFSELISTWGDCTALENVINPLLDEYNQTVIEACDYYNQLCSNPASGVSNCVECDSNSDKNALLQTTINEVIYCGSSSEQYCPSTAECSGSCPCACSNQTFTVEECATSCLDPSYRSTAQTLTNYANTMAELDAMIALTQPYSGCQIIDSFSEVVNEPLCVTFLSGDFFMVLSLIGFAFLWPFYGVLLLLSYERSSLCLAKEEAEEGYDLPERECETAALSISPYNYATR